MSNQLAEIQNIMHYFDFYRIEDSGNLRQLFLSIMQVLECQEERAKAQGSRIEQLEEKFERLKNAFEEELGYAPI